MEAKQIKMFCIRQKNCDKCPLKLGDMGDCLLESQPYEWNLELIEFTINGFDKAKK